MVSKKKKCEICGEPFILTRTWSKYCSDVCRKKANLIRVRRHRKKCGSLKAVTLEDLKTKDPYKKNYEKIIKAISVAPEAPFIEEADDIDLNIRGYKPGTKGEARESYLQRHEKQWGKVTWSHIQKETGLSNDTIARYLSLFRKYGVIEKDSYLMSKKYRLEALKLRQKDIILKTSLEKAIFHPSPYHSYTYYAPWISVNRIQYSVKDLKSRIDKIENNLKLAQEEWISILSEARDGYLIDFWNENLLLNNDLSVITKFYFALDMIFNKCILHLFIVSPGEKTIGKQSERFNKIQRNGFEKYIKLRYSTITTKKIKALHEKIKSEYDSERDFFIWMKRKIEGFNNVSTLEHIIVVDFLGASSFRYNKLIKYDMLPVVNLNTKERISKLRDDLKDKSDKEYQRTKLDDNRISNMVNTKKIRYIDTPFFKKYFKSFEQDLLSLGFVDSNECNRLERFYMALDGEAQILRIPQLPSKISDIL